MASIGERLRQERQRQNLELAQVADQTKINWQFLEAIEAEDWERLPGRFFVQNFVRQYARALGIDDREVDTELERLFKAEQPASVAETSPPEQRIHLPPVPTGVRQRGLGKHRWLPPFVLFVGIGMLCWGAYLAWQWGQQNLPPQAERPKTPSRPKKEPVVSTEPERRGEESSLSNVPQLSRPQENLSALPLPEKLLLNLTATEETWISVRVDGREVFSGILGPGDRKSFEAARLIRLHTGNAGGLEIQWNGKPVSPIGRKGEVRIVEFTPEGPQIQKAEP